MIFLYGKTSYTENATVELELHWVPRRALGYVLEKHGESRFDLVSGDGVNAFELNETGALIWQLCDDQRTIEEITVLLADLYPESYADIPKQTNDIISILMDHGVLYSLM